MGANLDSKIELNALNSLSQKEIDLGADYDDEFLNLYENVIKEADVIRDKPANFVPKTNRQKVSDKKRIVLVESIVTDDDEAFVRNLYIKVLGREPDKSGHDNLIAKLNADKSIDRENIIYSFWKTPEGQKRNIEVVGFHKVYMDELLTHEGKDFVEHAFFQILGRKCDEQNAKNYLNAMVKEGKSKEEIIRIIKDSDECKRRKVTIEGFEKAYKSRKRKEKILAKPVIGNAVLAVYNILHINRRLTEINDRITKTDLKQSEKIEDLSNRIDYIREDYSTVDKDFNKVKESFSETENRLRTEMDKNLIRLEKNEYQIGVLSNLDVTQEYIEKLNMLLSSSMTVWGPRERLHISKRASVYTCFFNTNSGEITVGDYTFAGSGVSILAGSHDKNLKGLVRRDADETEGFDIKIGNGVWLGSNATILGPATIGDNAVIAAGAVVTPGTVVPENTVYGGIPAKQIGDKLVFDEGISDSLIKAFERKDGILFTEGWSEKNIFIYEGVGTVGYHLLDKEGKVLIKSGKYSLKYAFVEDKNVKLEIDGGEKETFELSEKEGILDFEVKDDEEKKGYRFVTFNIDSSREDFALMIFRK